MRSTVFTSLKTLACTAASIISNSIAETCLMACGALMTKSARQIVNPTRTAAAKLSKGESHPLGIVIEPGMAYPPRYTQLQVVQPNQQFNADLGVGWEASSNDDVLQMWLGTGPQLDGLGHMGEAGEFYNCNKEKIFRSLPV